jgi:hypothetical protein
MTMRCASSPSSSAGPGASGQRNAREARTRRVAQRLAQGRVGDHELQQLPRAFGLALGEEDLGESGYAVEERGRLVEGHRDRHRTLQLAPSVSRSLRASAM